MYIYFAHIYILHLYIYRNDIYIYILYIYIYIYIYIYHTHIYIYYICTCIYIYIYIYIYKDINYFLKITHTHIYKLHFHILHIYVYYIFVNITDIFSMAYESNSCPCMRTSWCSNRLVVRHHASTLQARGKRHKIKKIRISFLWAAVDVQPGHAITETKCKSSRERTWIFFRFGSPKASFSITPKERHSGLGDITQLTALQCRWQRSIAI